MKSTTNQRKEHVGYNSVAIFLRLAVVASHICEIQGCRGYGDSHGDSHGFGYGMGMGTVMNPHGFCG